MNNPKTSIKKRDAYSLHVNSVPFYLKDWDTQVLSLGINLHRPLYHRFKLRFFMKQCYTSGVSWSCTYWWGHGLGWPTVYKFLYSRVCKNIWSIYVYVRETVFGYHTFQFLEPILCIFVNRITIFKNWTFFFFLCY